MALRCCSILCLPKSCRWWHLLRSWLSGQIPLGPLINGPVPTGCGHTYCVSACDPVPIKWVELILFSKSHRHFHKKKPDCQKLYDELQATDNLMCSVLENELIIDWLFCQSRSEQFTSLITQNSEDAWLSCFTALIIFQWCLKKSRSYWSEGEF